MDDANERWRRWLRPDVTLTVVALLAGASAALLSARFLSSRAAAVQAEVAGRYETVQVVVASADVARGDVLGASNLAARDVPRDFAPPDSVPAERAAELLGAHAAIDIRRGTPIVSAAIETRARLPALSSVLASGERALTLAVDELNSQAGALRAGDRIDIYYGRRDGGDALLAPLLQQVEILGVGEAFAAAGAGDAARHFATVTLRVPASDAPRLLLAQQAGELSMLLRGRADPHVDPAQIHNSRALLQLPTPPRARAPGIELIVGGSGELVPERTWLRRLATAREAT